MDRARSREGPSCLRERDLPRWIFVLLACALPLAAFAVHRGLGHAGDIGFFHEWYLAFRATPAFYGDGPGINYPIVGVLLVCGPAWIAERVVDGPLALSGFTLVLKSTLVCGEIAFIATAAWLGRVLGVARPRACALLLFLLPSSWAGSAWYGQTDVWGSALLVAAAAALVSYRREGRTRWLAIGLAALHLALLSKQLTWFAAPGLVGLAILGLRAHASWRAAVAAVLSPLIWLAADPFLTLPDGYRSHLAFVLAGGGSSHGELAVASGASVWSLFVSGGTPAADVRVLGLTSLVWGWMSFAAAMAASLARTLRAGVTDRALVVFAGLGQLAMATLLTGVHERYLVHAVPLLLLATARRERLVLGAVTGALAGVFVLSTIHAAAFTGPLLILTRPEPLAILQLLWLVSWLAWVPSRRASPGVG